jgi:hypothetical protein
MKNKIYLTAILGIVLLMPVFSVFAQVMSMPRSFEIFENKFSEFDGMFNSYSETCMSFCSYAMKLIAFTGNAGDARYNCMSRCVYGGYFTDVRGFGSEFKPMMG